MQQRSTKTPQKSNQRRLFESLWRKLKANQQLFANMYLEDQIWVIEDHHNACLLIANVIEKLNSISINPFSLSTPKHIKNAKRIPDFLGKFFLWRDIFMDMREEYLLWLNYQTEKKIPLIINIIRNRAALNKWVYIQPEVRTGDIYVQMDGRHHVDLAGHTFNEDDARRAWFSYAVRKTSSEDYWSCLVASMGKDGNDLPFVRSQYIMGYKVNPRIREKFSKFGIEINDNIFTDNLRNLSALKKFD